MLPLCFVTVTYADIFPVIVIKLLDLSNLYLGLIQGLLGIMQAGRYLRKLKILSASRKVQILSKDRLHITKLKHMKRSFQG